MLLVLKKVEIKLRYMKKYKKIKKAYQNFYAASIWKSQS